MRIPPGVTEAMRAHAQRAWPEECCGALLQSVPERRSANRLVPERTVISLPLENVASDRRRGFSISARDYLRVEAEAEARGLQLAGFYHSHVDAPATPSPADAATAWPQFLTVIVPVSGGLAGTPRAFAYDDATRTFSDVHLEVAP